MGKPTTGAAELGQLAAPISGTGSPAGKTNPGTLVAGETSPWFDFNGPWNVTVWGNFNSAVAVEYSYDGGSTAVPATNSNNAIVSFNNPISTVITQIEPGVLLRLRYPSGTGTVNYRVSR